jgi:hypothetical protein
MQGKPLHVVNLYNALEQRRIVVVEVRARESSGCEKRRRRIYVTGEEAKNGLQRTVRQSSRSETVKNTE